MIENQYSSIDKLVGENVIQAKINQLIQAYNKEPCYPKSKEVLRPFLLTNLQELKVVILVESDVSEEPHKDITKVIDQLEGESTESLSFCDLPFGDPFETDYQSKIFNWRSQGVLVLTENLSKAVGKEGSHSYIWGPFMVKLIKGISLSCPGIVFILIGKASKYREYIHSNNFCLVTDEVPLYECMKKTSDIILSSNDIKINWI